MSAAEAFGWRRDGELLDVSVRGDDRFEWEHRSRTLNDGTVVPLIAADRLTSDSDLVELLARAIYEAQEGHDPRWTWERALADDEMFLTVEEFRHQAAHALAALRAHLESK